jgi:hypothetical protein
MSKLFGFLINKRADQAGQSPVPPTSNEDITTVAGGYFGTYVDVEGGNARNEFELIKRYRSMALHPEIDSAVDEIVNEFLVTDANDAPVEIELSNLNVGAGLKKKIRDEFDYILKMLDFDLNAHNIIRQWYIDGRLYYHKVIDLANPNKGITELRQIDPLKIKKVRQKIGKDSAEEHQLKGTALEYDWGEYIDYYVYNPRGFGGNLPAVSGVSDYGITQGVRIASDAITYCGSGLQDMTKKMTLSFLHKAIKVHNQLRMIEDAIVIYRLSRAPERRIFYIDVGNLPKVKAEQYLRDVMARYRNKLVYDANTGEIRDDKKHMSMLEDFWLPRREGGRGTEISVLPGGQNLGELKDLEYFKKKLYNSLNLPPSRLTDDNKGFNLGKTTEVLRDELKFTKFIGRLRKRFTEIFNDVLKTQLILKRVITPEDWEDMKEHIQYDFLFDNHFNELKEAELNLQRIQIATQFDMFVGKYVSIEWVRKKVLMQSEKEYKEIDKQMNAEIGLGLVMDPTDVNTFDMMDRQNQAFAPEMDAQNAEDQHLRDQEAADADHKREIQKMKAAPKPKPSSSSK